MSNFLSDRQVTTEILKVGFDMDFTDRIFIAGILVLTGLTLFFHINIIKYETKMWAKVKEVFREHGEIRKGSIRYKQKNKMIRGGRFASEQGKYDFLCSMGYREKSAIELLVQFRAFHHSLKNVHGKDEIDIIIIPELMDEHSEIYNDNKKASEFLNCDIKEMRLFLRSGDDEQTVGMALADYNNIDAHLRNVKMLAKIGIAVFLVGLITAVVLALIPNNFGWLYAMETTLASAMISMLISNFYPFKC